MRPYTALSACAYVNRTTAPRLHVHITNPYIQNSVFSFTRPSIRQHRRMLNESQQVDTNNTTNRYIILSERLTTANHQHQMGTTSLSTQIVVITRPASMHCALTLVRSTIDTLVYRSKQWSGAHQYSPIMSYISGLMRLCYMARPTNPCPHSTTAEVQNIT